MVSHNICTPNPSRMQQNPWDGVVFSSHLPALPRPLPKIPNFSERIILPSILFYGLLLLHLTPYVPCCLLVMWSPKNQFPHPGSRGSHIQQLHSRKTNMADENDGVSGKGDFEWKPPFMGSMIFGRFRGWKIFKAWKDCFLLFMTFLLLQIWFGVLSSHDLGRTMIGVKLYDIYDMFFTIKN